MDDIIYRIIGRRIPSVQQLDKMNLHPLSDQEMKQFSNKHNLEMELVMYNQVPEDLHEFARMLPLIILLRWTESYGHWLLVHRTYDQDDNSTIEHFNSYGKFMDMQQEKQKSIDKQLLGQEYPVLIKLFLELKEHNIPVSYNEHRFQGPDKQLATCGKHCLIRLYFGNLSLVDYTKLLKICLKLYNLPTVDHLISAMYNALK